MEKKTLKKGILIDVREPKEFRDDNIPGSINIPSTKFNASNFEQYHGNMICLICQTGSRASVIKNKLDENGFKNVYLLERQMADIQSSIQPISLNGWTVDRQFRMFLGLLLAIFLIGFYFGVLQLVIIPVILSVGLIFTSIIDRCYLRMGIAKLPWNKKKGKK